MSQKRDPPKHPPHSQQQNPKNQAKGSIPKKSTSPDHNYNMKEIEIPGYFIEATLDLPRYHPHSIWWLAYISRLLKADSLDKLIENPPWPKPKDNIIISQLIKEMIDFQWLIPNWTSGNLEVAPKIKEIYNHNGEIGLARHYLQNETIPGQWWMDGLQGTPMDIRTAQSYDIDYGKRQIREAYRLMPDIPPEVLLEFINIDLLLLTRMLQIQKKDYEELLPRAFLSSPFRISGSKDLRFEMFGDPDKAGQRILPGNLAVLEPMLWSEAPEIFGRKPQRKKKLFQWRRSPVEKFALTLEKFPDYLSLLASGQYYKNLGQILIDELKKKDFWLQWMQKGMDLIPIAGYSQQFFDALGEICDGTTGLEEPSEGGTSDNKEVNSPEIILMSSSFLNPGNLDDNAGLVEALRYCSPTAKVLIIYGHANDDLPEKQQKDIQFYLSKLFSLEPRLQNRVVMIAAMKRSHEKIVLSSKGHWFIGSWNPCSSNPDSTMFEAGVIGKSHNFALEILEVIKEIIEDKNAKGLVNQLEDCYRNAIAKFAQEHSSNKSNQAQISYEKLSTALVTFCKRLLNSTSKQTEYEQSLYNIRLALVPFLQKGQTKLVNEHQTRDVLISQIHFTYQDIFLSSDRLTKGALDRTIVQDILEPSIESRRYLRILWGRDWEESKQIDPESHLQNNEARRAIRDAMEALPNQMKTSLNPMENHAKMALFDGSRGLITSENILSYGGEKNQYESRELGVFIESLPVIRFFEGKSIYHRLPLLQGERTAPDMVYRPYEWITAITDQFYALENIQNELNFDYSALKYLESALELHHTKPDVQEINNPKDKLDLQDNSDFDNRLLRARWECYLARQKGIQGSFITNLFRSGIRYYLLLPTNQPKWRPYSLPLDPSESISLTVSKNIFQELEGFNLLNSESESSQQPLTSNISGIGSLIEEIMRDMVKIQAGTFLMGDAELPDNRPVHKVTLTQPFYMGKYMVTQELWKKVMGNLPSIPPNQRSPKFPIIYVNYYDIMKFIDKLNTLPGGGGFDLPTDAQWEYVCRAGSTGAYCFGDEEGRLNEYAWSQLNAGAKIHDVGLLKANGWGLYDMHGLEFELVKDGYRRYTAQPITDPIGPYDERYFVCRGGHWGRYPFNQNKYFRCGSRYSRVPKDDISARLSFRLIRKIL